MSIHHDALTKKNAQCMVTKCQVCEAKDLYLQKDFPRVIALSIVALGIVTVPWTMGFSLIGVAIIDFVLYQFVPWMCVCYRCHTEYRGFSKNPVHQEFDRHLDELYKY